MVHGYCIVDFLLYTGDINLKYFPDLISVIGLLLLGYGLFLVKPWISFAVCGSIMLTGGVLLSIPKGK